MFSFWSGHMIRIHAYPDPKPLLESAMQFVLTLQPLLPFQLRGLIINFPLALWPFICSGAEPPDDWTAPELPAPNGGGFGSACPKMLQMLPQKIRGKSQNESVSRSPKNYSSGFRCTNKSLVELEKYLKGRSGVGSKNTPAPAPQIPQKF